MTLTPGSRIGPYEVVGAIGATSFGLAKDGRFLRAQPVQPDPPPTRVDIVINWREELRRLIK